MQKNGIEQPAIDAQAKNQPTTPKGLRAKFKHFREKFKSKFTRKGFLLFGSWGYGIIGLIVAIASVIIWIFSSDGTTDVAPGIQKVAIFAGLIGTGLTITGIGLAILSASEQKEIVPISRIENLESQIEEISKASDKDKMDEILHTLNQIKSSVAKLNVETVTKPKETNPISRRGRNRRRNRG